MVKESLSSSSRDVPLKKRRKNTAIDSDTEVDVYKKVINFEEKEAFKRCAESDAKLYIEICKSVRYLLGEILELKLQKTPEVAAKISEKITQVSTYVIMLKKLNRLEKVRSTSARETLNAEKQKVDSTNLQYQNLMYEAAHLFSEFKKCKQFKSKDEDIELVPIEEFLKEAPETKTKPFKNFSSLNDQQKHELHLARLEWELTQRKKLAELCHTFEDEKKQIAADIIKSKNRLGGLAPKLAAVLESTKPLQEYLGLPIEKTYAEQKQALLLPNPLLLFYANTDAFKKVYNIDVTLEIVGDEDEALQWKQQQNTQLLQLEDSDQEELQEESTETKKRRHRKASQADRHEERKKRLLEAHPLSVKAIIKINDGVSLKMDFNYRVLLNIITVTSETEHPAVITGNTAKEILSGDSLLSELFEGDLGTNSPNSSNLYQFKKIGLGSYESLIPNLGYAYCWAQSVCGLDFLLTQKTKTAAASISSTNVEIVMKALNKRLKSRMALALQLQQLEQNQIPTVPEIIDLPRNAISSLSKWTSINWQDFCAVSSTTDLIENEIVGPNDLFYMAIISRPKSATLQALVAIKNNYPKQPPIFAITVKYNGEFHSRNSDEVRDIERNINIGWTDNSSDASWLIAAQLCHLCAYFDIYLETVTLSSFPQNTVFFKSISGRNRRRPFKFKKVGAGIFTQF